MQSPTHHASGHEFWVSSGHLLLQRNDAGQLAITDEFLKAFYARPEVLPPPEACDAERALHARLMIAACFSGRWRIFRRDRYRRF